MSGYGSYYNVPGARASMSGLGCGCSLGAEENQQQKPAPERTLVQKHTDEIIVFAFVSSLVLAGGAIYFVAKELT